MRKRIASISVVQAGLVLGAIYVIVALFAALILALIMSVGLLASAGDQVPDILGGGLIGMIFLVVVLPIAYGVIGFFAGMIAALVYNLVAKVTGGLEVTFTDIPYASGTY